MKKIEIKNKKATFDFEILDKIQAGIVLKGSEVKAFREGKVNLKDSFVQIDKNNEVWLKNAHFSTLNNSNIIFQHEEIANRKLLLNKNEIKKLKKQVDQKGLTIVPLKMYFDENNRIKVLIALARGKNKVDKRNSLKEKSIKRDIDRNLKLR